MQIKSWHRLPEKFRETAIVLFQSQDIDFEKTFLTDDSQGGGEKQDEVSPWMSRKEAAAYAGVREDTIDNWRKAGYIKDCKLAEGRPGRVLIDRKSLKRYLASRVINDPYKRARATPMKGAQYRVG